MSNGQTQAVTTGWRSDAPTVATITDGGNLTAVANGEATITVAFGGAQGTKRIRVAPNYDGRWPGMQVINACAATGDFAGICDEGGTVVSLSFPVSATMRHPGELLVSGEFMIETLSFPTFSARSRATDDYVSRASRPLRGSGPRFVGRQSSGRAPDRNDPRALQCAWVGNWRSRCTTRICPG